MSDKQARDEAIKQASEQVRNATTPFLRHAGDPVSAPDPVQELWDYCAIVDDRTAIARKREYRERGDALAAALESEREDHADAEDRARAQAEATRNAHAALEAERERVQKLERANRRWAEDCGQRDERIAALEAGLRELREGADRAVLDLKHDAVVGAPWVARVSNDLLERP